MSRPNKLPSWVDDDSATKVTEPSTTKKSQGWICKERPAFQFWNWIFRNFVKWILHLDVSVNHFDPHEALTPNMTVVLSAGRVQNGITLTEVAEQTTSAFTAPTTNPRIDRIVVDNVTGVYSVIPGAEAASPVAPDLTSGKIAVCQVLFQTTTTEITNDLITDERAFIQQPPILNTKKIDIGDWDMDADGTNAVAHGLTYSKIINVSITIRSDDDARKAPLDWDNGSSIGGYFEINATNILLSRVTGGAYDDIAYDSTSYNRGWIIIQYEN